MSERQGDQSPPSGRASGRYKSRSASLGFASTAPKPALPLEHLRQLLSVLRDHGALSLSALSQYLGASRSKVDRDVTDLAQAGFVARTGAASSSGGRPSRDIALSSNLRFLRLDIGATSMAAAVTDAYIKPIDFIEESSDVRSGPQPVLEQAAGLIAKMTSGYDERLIGIRVGLPGPVRFRDGAPIATPIMPGWDGYPVRDALSESLEVPVTVDNDVNIMALGEQHRDVARGISDFLFVKIGTGIGSGIICRGKIHRGADGCAGDIGHIAVSSSNTLCHCGRLGCLESEFSGVALAAKALSAAQLDAAPFLAQALIDRGRVTAEDVALGSSTGDATSVGLIREGGELLGQLLAGLVNFFNPSMIVMGGGLASFGHPLIAAVRSAIFRRSAPLATSNLSIVRSQLGAQVGVIGAAFLASEAFLNGSDWVVRCLNKVKV